jgi:anti-sigma-K factor RskA
MPTTDPSAADDGLLAAELALGVLDGEERAAAIRRQLADPGFAREVALWTDRFALMFAAWPEEVPPPALERRVMARVRGANDNSRPWKWATGMASAIAAALALLLVARDPATAPSPAGEPPVAMVAALAPAGEGKPVALMVDAARGTMTMSDGIDVPGGRDAQLWLIEGSGAPQPLGVLKRTGKSLVATITLDRPIPAGATIAVSIEPLGGSPTGQPTGPVVASGTIDTI